MIKMRNIIIIITLLLFLTSCATTPVWMSPTTTTLHDKKITENLGEATGKDTTWSLFGLWMMGSLNIDNAVNEALLHKNGDALINAKCYRSYTWFILFSLESIKVSGEAVKLEPVEVARK